MLTERRRNIRILLLLVVFFFLIYPFYQSGYRIEEVGANPVVDKVDHWANYVPDNGERVIYSQSTPDRKYFSIDFAGDEVYNPSIIPHPTAYDKWIVSGQHGEYRDDINSSEQLVCIATFVDGVLHCRELPSPIALAPSIEGRCNGQFAIVNLRRGPRDGRVFYGPDAPFIIYGSQSSYTCMGVWLQDMRMLLDIYKHPKETFARGVTELRRAPPIEAMEEKYFLFWDGFGQAFAHYSSWPKRSFSKLKFDGSTESAFLSAQGLDLAPLSADEDKSCIARYLPKAASVPGVEGIDQATNSLSITLCKRKETSCTPNDDNTFIMHIIQHKTIYQKHGRYEPYVVLFRRRAPFELYGISNKPLWYHGRDKLTEKTGSRLFEEDPQLKMPTNHTEMFYTSSISWKSHNQRYHGYVDDVMFINFGIEDTRSGAIDVLASDVLQDVRQCA